MLEADIKAYIEKNKESLLETVKELCAIPAPSHMEQKRATYCKNWLEKAGAEGVYIDAGANAIVGHGPHLLRPIEVYKDSPIFYSLGDFVLQLYDIELAPEDFFAKHGLTSASTVHDLLKKRFKNFTVGLMTDKRMFQTVIPFWETEGTKLVSLKLLPVEAAMEGNHSEIGLPRRSTNPKIAEYLGAMCAGYGTKIIRNEDGTLSCKW